MLLGIRWGSLRAKIIAWSFVPTAIILTAVALVGFYAYQQVTENLTVASSRELARLSAGQLAAQLTEYSDTLTALARTEFIYFGEPDTQQSVLMQASNRLAIFDGGVLILDNYGKVAATQPLRLEIIGQDWSSRDYFRQMIRTQGTVYSNIVNDGPGGARVIVVAVPIINDRGEFVGTVNGMFRVGPTSVTPFYGGIVRLRIGGNGAAYLVDRTGWVIYHSNADQIDQNLVGQRVVQQALGEQAGALRTRDSAGKEIVASFAPVPGTPWELVIEQNWDALLAPGQSYLQSLFLLLVLGLITPALVVMIGVRRITEPINQLIAATQEVAGGHLGQKITVRTGDELAELGEQFNRMSAQLAASYEQLKTREERFALVMQGTNDGIWDWDLQTDDVYFSPRWKSMLGYADDELANRFETWRGLLHPDDLKPTLTRLNDYLERRSSVYQIEFRMRHKDGSYRWISARAGALWNAQGHAYRMTGSHTDITERKQAEEALRQSQKRFSQVFHASPVAVSITALEDGRYIDVNNAWLRLFGYKREEVIDNTSLHLNIWLHPGQRATMIQQLQTTGSVRDFEHLARTKAGEVRDVLVSAEVIELGDQRYNLSSVIDITGHKRAEEEIRRQNEYLAALHETALGVISRLEVRELLETIVERAIKLVDATDGFVYLVTPGGNEIETTVGTGSHRKYIGLRLARGEGLSGKIWETGQPMAVEEYRTWLGRSRQFDDTPIGPEVGAPLKSGSEVVGVIGLTREVSAPPFTQDEIDLMSRFAQLASIALDNARLHSSVQQAYQTLERRVEERTKDLAALNSITAVVSRSLDLREVMKSALGKTMQAAKMERGLAYRLDEASQTLWLMAHDGFSNDFVRKTAQLPLQLALAGKQVREDLPLVWDVNTDYPDGELKDLFQREKLKLVVGVPLMAKKKLVGGLVISTATPRALTSEESSLLSAIGQQVGIAIENARLFESEQDRREEVERRRQVAEALREILAVLNSTRSLEEILNHIAAQARRLLGSDSIALFRLDQENQVLRIRASEGLDADYATNIVVPVGLGAVGRAVLERQPVFISDRATTLAELATFPIDSKARPSVERTVEEFKTLVGIPLILKDEVYGAIALYYNTTREFTEEEIALAVTFADQAALAIENARLRNQAERGAALAERSRLARDLHDSVTQSLYSVTLYAEATARLMTAGEHAQAAEHLRELRDTAQEALREMRLLIFELRLPVLEKTGLGAALQARLDSVELRGGIKAELHVEGEEHLSPRVQEELYHIAQEALNNALKHSNAQRVQVHLRFREATTSLEICDDGVGFESEQIGERGGLGFKGMQERAQRIGGNLQIDSAPEKGTRVRIEVPISNPKQIGGIR